jgi:hypothetical protein
LDQRLAGKFTKSANFLDVGDGRSLMEKYLSAFFLWWLSAPKPVYYGSNTYPKGSSTVIWNMRPAGKLTKSANFLDVVDGRSLMEKYLSTFFSWWLSALKTVYSLSHTYPEESSTIIWNREQQENLPKVRTFLV